MALLVLVPLCLLALALFAAVAPLIRMLFRIALAAGAALVATALLPLDDKQGWVPFVVFVVVLILASRGERRREGRRNRVDRRAAMPASRPPVPLPQPDWKELRQLAGWGQSRRLEIARASCARYLELAETEEDPSAQLPIRLRRHLPALVDDCIRHCRTATRDEQRTLVAQTLTTIETIAAQAETRRRELAHRAQSGFRARQAHLAREGD